MARDYAASIRGERIRLTELGATGNVQTAGEVRTLSNFITVSFTPEYEEGEEMTSRNAAGVPCVDYKMPDSLRRVSIELAICNPDPDLDVLLAEGSLGFSSGDSTIGFAAPAVGASLEGNGVALEVWSSAIVNGKPASANPYWRWLFPLVHLRPSGTREIGASVLANTYSGYGIGNKDLVLSDGSALSTGIALGSPYMYIRASTIPSVETP